MRPRGTRAARLPAALLVTGLWACSLVLDYDSLESGEAIPADAGEGGEDVARPAPDARDAADAVDAAPDVPVPSVRCGDARCAGDEVCCLDVDGGAACTAVGACAGAALVCDGAEDCADGLACCGWGRWDSADNPLVVACRSVTECAAKGGSREFCDPDAPACDAGQACVRTDTVPGAFKCE